MDVLLVEDEPLIRTLLWEVLQDAGLEVAEASNAEAALSVAVPVAGPEDPPAVVVTDVDLGRGMDGIALAREARRRWPGVGIVFMTGRPSNLDGHALGARDRFLPKPFLPDALVGTVRGLMGSPRRPRPFGMAA